MLLKYIDLILKACSIGIILVAAGLWTGAGVESRPRYKDQQTLVGGAIWSQVLIPVGLLISAICGEHVYSFVMGYFFFTGIALLSGTGIVLIRVECKALILKRELPQPTDQNILPIPMPGPFDRIYFCIGVLCLLAVPFKICEFVIMFFILITGLLAFGAYWTTKYLLTMPEATPTSAARLAENMSTSFPGIEVTI